MRRGLIYKMFSVVIPIYNSEKTIIQVLDSVRLQTRADLVDEVILVNDGSTDNSEKIVQKYIDEHKEFNIIYIYQKNKGPSAARNKGLIRASSEWIALLDSDDVWHKNKIEKQYRVIKENPEIVFLGAEKNFRILFKKHSGLYKAKITDLCWKSFPVTPSIVFRKSAIEKVGFFNENRKYGEDIEYYQKFCIYYNYYILCEDLVDIGIQKKGFAESGLTSNLYLMHLGRCENLKEIYKMNAISKYRYCIMQSFNWIKYFRRLLLVKLDRFMNR